MVELKGYQENAVLEMCEKSQKILGGSPANCVFKSPTGSGKTLMMAEVIKRLSCNMESRNRLSYIWISVHKLHQQSKKRLEEYYDGLGIITCSEFPDLESVIAEDEVLFFNWPSITRADNIFIRESETQNNLSAVLQNTRDAGRKIVLIIDESHDTADGEKAQKLIDEIDADLTIEVSATPSLKKVDEIVRVSREDVVNEEMVKKSAHVNHALEDFQVDEHTTDDIIILAALEQREHIHSLYKKENSNVNPLLLIQLPNSSAGIEDMNDEIVSILKDKGITLENEKLAIHLFDEHENLKGIADPDNKAEVMIFKQAVALGWDCPRASVLLPFRVWKRNDFSIQVVGRIMRTPEHRFYENDELNHSYIYCNLREMEIVKDVAKDHMVFNYSRRNEDLYDGVELESKYVRRRHEKTRISGKITEIMRSLPNVAEIAGRMSQDTGTFVDHVMSDGEVVKLDEEQTITGARELDLPMGRKKLNFMFESFVRGNVGKFAPRHSTQSLCTAIYKFCEMHLGTTDYLDVQKIVMSEKNNVEFINLIDMAVTEYAREVATKTDSDKTEDVIWTVPKTIGYGDDYEEVEYRKSVMVPVIGKNNDLEVEFMEFMDRSDGVSWWFRNGVRDKKYFAIVYQKDGDSDTPFYVDFILKMKDERIGLFDTKDEHSDDPAKGAALRRYIKRNKAMFGGLVMKKGESWRYSDTSNIDDKSTWKYLNLS